MLCNIENNYHTRTKNPRLKKDFNVNLAVKFLHSSFRYSYKDKLVIGRAVFFSYLIAIMNVSGLA